MSNIEESVEKPFFVDIAKQGRAVCKKCKEKCIQGEVRIAKLVANPFGSSGGKIKAWHHINCLFELFAKQRPTTKRIESPDDIGGWDLLDDNIQNDIAHKVIDCNKAFGVDVIFSVKKKKLNEDSCPKKKSKKNQEKGNNIKDKSDVPSTSKINDEITNGHNNNKDDSFREFRRLVANISNVSSYLEKTKLVSDILTKEKFKGDIVLWTKLLLPGSVKRIYNLQSKQLIKLCARIFHTDQNEMLEDLEKGDIGETIQLFFEKSKHVKPIKKSNLTLQQVDKFLEELTKLTKEDDQINLFKKIIKKCTPNDLKIIIRLIKHDLRMNAGAKHILDGIHPDAYDAFQSSRDLQDIVNRFLKNNNHDNTKSKIKIMTPVLPMLAEACKTIDQAMKKCPNGMLAEVKYDGERVQIHKCGDEFKFFSRSLKPVLTHKISHFKEYIPKAFPNGNDLILDGEILMIDTKTSTPLPFGTLGIHKKSEFADANVCLFVFDCIYYNGEDLTDKSIESRKKKLYNVMKEIKNHIVFAETNTISEPDELSKKIVDVFKLGLEGLVLKDLKSNYEPGKRHWLKIKKDYLFDGSMADSADLIVLGAWYGTGKKGGMMSVFLMGCYDKQTNKFYTVTKVHTGHDDKTLDKLQDELKMIKISGDLTKLPDWLKCTKTMIPDFIAEDPKQQPVWEISGAEFTQHDVHTADGISIRFPRITKIREDKNWKTATNLDELKDLFKKSKENTDFSYLLETLKKSHQTEKEITKDIDKQKNKKRKTDTEDNNKKLKKFKIDIDTELDKIKNPLLDIFENIYLYVENDNKNFFNKWLRYFIAYGGILLDQQDISKATHVLHREKSIEDCDIKFNKNTKHVTIEWIKNSINKNSLQDVKPYVVQWIPNQVHN